MFWFKKLFAIFLIFFVRFVDRVTDWQRSVQIFPLFSYLRFPFSLGYLRNTVVTRRYSGHREIEFVWTAIPTFVLFCLSVPSLVFLYNVDPTETADLSLKVVGHQWYWSYESNFTMIDFFNYVRTHYVDHDVRFIIPLLPYINPSPRETPFYTDIMYPTDLGKNIDFNKIKTSGINALIARFYEWPVVVEQYRLNDADLKFGDLRLLETNTTLVLPINRLIKVYVTSTDVIHSWTIPGIGVKLDAVPGRLNVFYVQARLPGIFHGQCSELCGVNHAFMPIKVMFVSSLN